MQEIEPESITLLKIPDFAVVVLIGVSGSGKSTFAARHFLPSEVLSSDAFRAMVGDDENDQSATNDAFDALHYLASIRLRRRKLIVVDATNVQAEARKPLLELAAHHDCLAVAIVLDVPERVCRDRNQARADRQFGPHVLANQSRQLRQSLRSLKREGFRYVFTLAERQIAEAQIERTPLWTDRRDLHGPFDIVGDVHGCCDELTELLSRLGYAPDAESIWRHPEGRRVIFIGDLVDRGPKVVETVLLALAMVASGSALCIPGNHDMKLMRALQGRQVKVSHGLLDSLDQIEALPEAEREAFKKEYVRFADALVSHFWLDGGRLCVAHAGMKEEYIGRASGRVRDFALYGDTTGETDEFGLPVRYPWAADYRGATTVIYGHTPVPEAEWLNNTINIDTGCVFGGRLTALRWPEREIVQVAAHAVYSEPARPFLHPEPAAQDTSGNLVSRVLNEMVAAHLKNRELVVQALALRNELQAETDREERMAAEMERKAGVSEEAGNSDLAAQFRREKTLHERTLAMMRQSLAETVEAVDKIKRAFLQERTRLQERAAAVQFPLPDLDVEIPPSAEEPGANATDDELEALINEDVRRMKANQGKNRELAVAAITQKNNLHAEVLRMERSVDKLEQETVQAEADGDRDKAEKKRKEKAHYEQGLEKLRNELIKIEAAAEKIKTRIKEEEERIRVRTGEALSLKARLTQTRIQMKINKGLEAFQSSFLENEDAWTRIEERIQALQAEEAARVEVVTVAPSMQWQHDELLRAEDVLGKRFISTRLMNNVTIPAENAAAALEVMSRFAVEPRRLIYLPPTMSPCETASAGDLLERPAEAFAYYRNQGVEQVVCQRKHMGSRAVIVVCRDAEAARQRFGAAAGLELPGQCYTRTGRQFFEDDALHAALLDEVSATLTRAGFWEEFDTDWACLDCELMPWNAKAQGLLREQYAPVGAAARTALPEAIAAVEEAAARGIDMANLPESLRRRQEDVIGYIAAYARYCWEVRGLGDLRLAPFHLLAAEGRTYFDHDHNWHAGTLARLAEHSDLLIATESRTVNTRDETSQAEGAAWWQELTESGGEGMVVKPFEFIVRGPKGLTQPAVKVRGREYLRIIYGPEYTEPANLDRLRKRGLAAKRSLALREFALGVEGLERFVRKEPLRRVHECAFGVLALESEPVDPRL